MEKEHKKKAGTVTSSKMINLSLSAAAPQPSGSSKSQMAKSNQQSQVLTQQDYKKFKPPLLPTYHLPVTTTMPISIPSATITRPTRVKTELNKIEPPSHNYLHWEVQCAKNCTVLTDTAHKVDRITYSSRASSKRAAAAKSILMGSMIRAPSTSSSSSSSFGNNPLKRSSGTPISSDTSKRIKLSSSSVIRSKERLPISKQWPNLLKNVIQKRKSSSAGTEEPLRQTSTAATTANNNNHHNTPRIPSLTPTPNSLLIKYDPIKILSRLCLVATSKNSQSTMNVPVPPLISIAEPQLRNPLPTSSQSVVRNEKSSGSSSQNQPSSSSIGQQRSKIGTKSLPNTQKQSTSSSQKQIESTMMPPPKFPPPWCPKKKVDPRSRVPHRSHSHTQGHQQTSTSSAAGASATSSSHQFISQLPCLLPKLNLTVPCLSVNKGLEVSYDASEADSPQVPESNLRLATIAVVRRVMRRNRIKRLIKNGKLQKETRKPVDSALTSLLNPAKPKTNPPDKRNPTQIPSKTLSTKIPPKASTVKAATSKSADVPPTKKKRNLKIITTIPENPLVDHTIDLLKDKRELQKRLELIEDEGIIYRLQPIPKLKTPIPKAELIEHNIPLTTTQTKSVLQQRLAILLAHGGFTHVNLRPLEVLADVMENFYKKTTHRLKQITEMEMSGCEQEFPDPLERVMVETGLGGVRGLEEFYQTRIVDYRKRLEDQCTTLREEYSKMVRLKVGKGFPVPAATGGSNSTSNSTSTSTARSIISSGTSSSKAKLKEALSQRNLLRLNFEQAPSNCDSTVILSSSSPSLSTSKNNSNPK